VSSLHALYKLWTEPQLVADRAFVASAVLQAYGSATEAEAGLYNDLRGKLPPQEVRGPITDAQLGRIMAPGASGPVSEVLRVIGDQLGKQYPPDFQGLGVDRKADRLKDDHPIYKHLRSIAHLLGVEELEVYLARKGLFTVEMGEPLCICVGPDLARRFSLRDLRYLMGRAVMGVRQRTALVSKISRGELTTLLGDAVRLHEPGYTGLGFGTEEGLKVLRKALSRKAHKALEAPALALAGQRPIDQREVDAMVGALAATAERVGVLLAGDPAVAVGMMLRDEPTGASFIRPAEGSDGLGAIRQRQDVQGVVRFTLSDDFFRLRQELGICLP
jgi:hypothetical protein